MKYTTVFLSLVSLVTLVIATPLTFAEGSEQLPFVNDAQTYPGFDLDLHELRLVQFEGQAPRLVSELEKIEAKAQGLKFFDITETPDLGSSAHLRVANKPTFPTPNATKIVKPILADLSVSNLQETLAHFTSFRTRYYLSDTGKDSQQWLFSKISEITAASASPELQDLISIREFPHRWKQSSIIVRINGSSTEDDGVIIIGAHQDSVNMWPLLPAPGADDDGSGSMTILESYRALLSAGFRPERAVEFHWYAGEEGGLLGSQAVAKDYEARDVDVLAMSQFDMTAWVKRGTREEVGIMTEFVSLALTDFNKQLVDAYLDIPYVETTCGYACSDHASWDKAGYASSFSFEGHWDNHNTYVHTTSDRFDISDEFSFTHMLEFSKLAVAFAVELGGWTKSD